MENICIKTSISPSFTFQYSIFNMQNSLPQCFPIVYISRNQFSKARKRKPLVSVRCKQPCFLCPSLYITPLSTFSHSLRVRIGAYQRGCIKSSCCGVLLRAQRLLLFIYALMLRQHKPTFSGFISTMTLTDFWIFPNCSQLPAEISCHSVLQQQATYTVISFCHGLERVSHDSVAKLLPR